MSPDRRVGKAKRPAFLFGGQPRYGCPPYESDIAHDPEGIGAGFGRTGTLSLKSALDELGLGPCYHMVETRAHPEHDTMWLALAKGEASDWRPMLKGYASTVDWPTTYFWKDLAAANPDAKIILTLRDPEAWYRSAAATIFARMLEFEALRADPDAVDPARRRHMEMVNTIVVEKTFGGSLDKDARHPSLQRAQRGRAPLGAAGETARL